MPEDVCDRDSDCTGHEYENSGVCAWESHAEVNRICCSSHSIVRGSSIVGKLMPSKFCNDHVPIGGECGVSEQCQEYNNRSYCAKGICQQKQSEGLACDDSMACMNEGKFSWCTFKIASKQYTFPSERRELLISSTYTETTSAKKVYRSPIKWCRMVRTHRLHSLSSRIHIDRYSARKFLSEHL